MRETVIVGDVLDALGLIQGGKFWRNNTGMAWLRGKGGQLQPVKFGENGAADILGAYLGRAVGIECKTLKGRQSPDQKKWQADFEAAGGLYILARSAVDVLTGLGVKAGAPRKPSGRIIYR